MTTIWGYLIILIVLVCDLLGIFFIYKRIRNINKKNLIPQVVGIVLSIIALIIGIFLLWFVCGLAFSGPWSSVWS